MLICSRSSMASALQNMTEGRQAPKEALDALYRLKALSKETP